MVVRVANAIHFTLRIGNIPLVRAALFAEAARAEIHTCGGSDNISRVDVVEVYFLPKGRITVPDWRDRLEYFARRIPIFRHHLQKVHDVLRFGGLISRSHRWRGMLTQQIVSRAE